MKNDLDISDRAFLLSAILGTAAAYSSLYLFHVVLLFKILKSAVSTVTGGGQESSKALRGDVQFFAVFLLWYAISILWADNKYYGAQYTIYIILASLTVFYIIQICRSLLRLQSAFKLISILVSVEIFFSVLEGLGIIRLPFSPFSPYHSFFGREPADLSEFGIEAIAYISSLPTGFFHNPNNLAAFLGLALPFFMLHPKWFVRIVGSVAIFFIVYMSGARAALAACGLVLFICVFGWSGFSGRIGVAASAVAAMMLGAGLFSMTAGSLDPRFVEVTSIDVTLNEFWVNLTGEQQAAEGGSVGARAELIRNGLYALQDSNGLGVGAGGSKTIQEQSFFVGDLTSMHSFWVEVLVEGGVLFAIIFAIWYAGFLWRLWKVAIHSSDPQLKYFGKAMFTGFVGFILGAVGPSTVIYMLPMWLMVGFGLSVIRVESLQSARVGLKITPDRTDLRIAGATPLRRSYK